MALHTPLKMQSSLLITGRQGMSFSHLNHSEMKKYFLELPPHRLAEIVPFLLKFWQNKSKLLSG